jgi:hypothetical protein
MPNVSGALSRSKAAQDRTHSKTFGVRSVAWRISSTVPDAPAKFEMAGFCFTISPNRFCSSSHWCDGEKGSLSPSPKTFMKAFFRPILSFVLLATFSHLVIAADFYVSPSGSHSPPFVDWSTAATNIQDAIDVAADGDVVWVTNGCMRLAAR